MKKVNLPKRELEQLCLKEKIIIEREDPVSGSTFFLHNLEKIGVMIREFDFLVEGASRGKAINEISAIEHKLFENEDNPDFQSNLIATKYSDASIFLESKKDLIADRKSDNWSYLFARQFSLYDLYEYFHKEESASSFFKRFKIYHEMVELNYYIKLMEYLQSQVQLLIPLDDDKEIPLRIDALELKLLVLQKTGLLQSLKNSIRENYYVNASKMLTTLLCLSNSKWRDISNILKDMDNGEETSIVSDDRWKNYFTDILYHYKIDLR